MERGECSTSTSSPAKSHRGSAFEGITPDPSSTSPPVMKKRPFDVFISHRGCDTKNTLASTIYHTLDMNNIHAFLDREELELGDSIPVEIQRAMDTAGLHIAIFSPRYAESPWCLAELSFMLQTGTPIIPIFYHVDPSDLRWAAQGNGCYALAFSKHEEKGRYPSNMLQDWKMALQSVSNLSGHVLNENTGDEGILLKTIVNSVLTMVKKLPLEVAKHPVGMDEIVQDFERSLKECVENEQGVQIVGIVGLGGSGKTTLATEVYNRKRSSINRSSFVDDVRDAADRNILHITQKKLLKDVRIQTESFESVKEGKTIIADRLRSLCLLIVLDDVDHEDQLHALLPPKESLGKGSVVIITTRDGDILTKWGVASIYKAKPLQHLHAEQLFCWHAFSQPYPEKGFEDLVESYVKSCSGLPLSLKVIGGQLYGKRSREYWVSQLRKIQNILPKDIFERLKVSYDALDKQEQEIFLDIACLLINEKKKAAIEVWDASGWSGLCSWETLQNKCLVESYEGYDGEEHIRMHDHLRDLGRRIAKTHSPKRIQIKETRFRGIAVSGDRRFKLESHGIEAIESTDKYVELLRGILWLEWSDFKGTSIPSWLPLNAIIFLEFTWPKCLETLWDDALPPLQLRELRIVHGLRLKSLPRSIGRLQHLKRLYVEQSRLYVEESRLTSLPEEFCELQLLEHLVFRECVALSSLPNRFGDLVKLQHLDLSYCKTLKRWPESFKQLIHLKYLDLGGCESLENLDNILEEFCELKLLEHLVLSRCNVVSLPNRFGDLVNLRHLDLGYCESLKRLPESFKKLIHLEYLNLDGCEFLESLDNIANLKAIYLGENRDRTSVQQLSLSFSSCFIGRLLPIISQLTELKELDIYDDWYENYSKESISIEISQMSSLQNLRINGFSDFYEITNLARLSSLTNLEVKYCKNDEIEGLKHLTSLENLVLWGIRWREAFLHSLWVLERLQTLNLKANDISDFGPCIQNIEMENWPREMTLWGGNQHTRSLHFDWGDKTQHISHVFRWILDSFTFHGVDVHQMREWSLTCWETDLSNAAVLCYLTECEGLCDVHIRKAESTHVKLYLGYWIVISVFKEVSYGGMDLNSVDISPCPHEGGKVEVLGGWVMVGKRASILNGFKQLFQTLSLSQEETLSLSEEETLSLSDEA